MINYSDFDEILSQTVKYVQEDKRDRCIVGFEDRKLIMRLKSYHEKPQGTLMVIVKYMGNHVKTYYQERDSKGRIALRDGDVYGRD